MAIDTSIYQLLRPHKFGLEPFMEGRASGLAFRRNLGFAQEEEAARARAEQTRQAYRERYGEAPGGLAGPAAVSAAPAGLGAEAPFPPLAEQEAAATQQALYGSPGMTTPLQAPSGPPPPGPYSQTLQAPSGPPPPGPYGRTLEAPGGPPPPGQYAQTMGSGALGSQSPSQNPFIRKLYTIDPAAGREAEKHALDSRKLELANATERVEYLGRVADGVLDVGTQEAHNIARAQLIQDGMPANQIPVAYDPTIWTMLSGTARTAADRLRAGELEVNRARYQLDLRKESRKVPDYGLGTDMNVLAHELYGSELAPGQPLTPGQVRQVRERYLRDDPEQRLKRAQARREEYEADATQDVQAEMAGSPRRMSEADIADAMTQTGRSRQEVITAAQAKGFVVEGESDTVTAAAPVPQAPAPAPGTAPAPAAAARPGAAPYRDTGAVSPASPAPAAAPVPQATAPAPGTSAAPAPAPALAAPAASAADVTRLRTLERRRDEQEAQVARVKRKWGTSEAGKTVVSQAEQELTRRNTDIERLRTRLEGPEQEARKTTAREEAQRQQLRGQTTAETLKEHAPQLYDVETATPINPTTPYGEVLDAQRAGTVRQLSKRQAERLEVAREAVPVLAKMAEYTERIYGAGGELESANPASIALLIKGTLTPRQMQEEFPLLTEAARYVEANAGSLARGLRGEVGAMSEQDVERAFAGLPNFRSVFKLGLGLGGAFSTRGVGPAFTLKPEFKPADTARVARGVLESTIDTLNTTTGAILGQKGFRYPELAWPGPVQGPPAPSPQQRQGPGTGARRLPSTYDWGRGMRP